MSSGSSRNEERLPTDLVRFRMVSAWLAVPLSWGLAACGQDETVAPARTGAERGVGQGDDAGSPANAAPGAGEDASRGTAAAPLVADATGSDLCFDVQSKFIGCGLGSFVTSGEIACDQVDSPLTDVCQATCLAQAECAELSGLLCSGEVSAGLDGCTVACNEASVFVCPVALPLDWVCDGEPDCLDGSDESTECPEPFTCNDGLELPPSWLCDGFGDCLEGEDEVDCGVEFECDDGVVLPPGWACDGFADCVAGEDEADCGPDFQCDDGTSIIGAWQCDGFPDCSSGEDEAACDNVFICDYSLPEDYFCTGSFECIDRSDEPANCTSSVSFACESGELVPIEWQCDSEADCLDGSDEADCPEQAPFACGDGNAIDQSSVCDRYVDCNDGSDEVETCWYRQACQ